MPIPVTGIVLSPVRPHSPRCAWHVGRVSTAVVIFLPDNYKHYLSRRRCSSQTPIFVVVSRGFFYRYRFSVYTFWHNTLNLPSHVPRHEWIRFVACNDRVNFLWCSWDVCAILTPLNCAISHCAGINITWDTYYTLYSYLILCMQYFYECPCPYSYTIIGTWHVTRAQAGGVRPRRRFKSKCIY